MVFTISSLTVLALLLVSACAEQPAPRESVPTHLGLDQSASSLVNFPPLPTISNINDGDLNHSTISIPDDHTDLCPTDDTKTFPGPCGCNVVDTDSDLDHVLDCVDNCVAIANTDQIDSDGDGRGAACECDDHNPALTFSSASECSSPIQ